MQDVQQTAALLAADLAGARVDPNEAQKALAYLRVQRETRALLDYLRAIVRNGQVVIRSRQTLDYYRALLEACERHLRGLSAEEAAQTLGWAIRLLRYYRAVPNAPRAVGFAPAGAQVPETEELPTPKAPPAARPLTPPKQGNDRPGTVSGRAGGRWLVELEGGFVVQASLSGQVRQVRQGDRVSVRITRVDGETLLGEIRKLL